MARQTCLLARGLLVTSTGKTETSGGGSLLFFWAFSHLFLLPGPQTGAVGCAHLVFELTVRLRIDRFSAL